MSFTWYPTGPGLYGGLSCWWPVWDQGSQCLITGSSHSPVPGHTAGDPGDFSLVKAFMLCFWGTHQLSQNPNIDPAGTIQHPSAPGCSSECSNHSFNHFYFIKKTPVPNLATRWGQGRQKYLMKQMIISGNEHEVWREGLNMEGTEGNVS